MNRRGLELLKRWEGLELAAYRCVASRLTIGYGHTGPDVTPGQRITPEKAELLLREDLEIFEKGVHELLKVPVSDNQFAALVSLAYNIGLSALKKSTLLRKLNAGEECADHFMDWNKATINGRLQPVKGLTARRFAERALFKAPPEEPWNRPTR